jgi:hypothetical protein
LYYLSNDDFHSEHRLLKQKQRWDVQRRPMVIVCLGKWCVTTHDERMFVCTTANEALATWLSLVGNEYQGQLESGLLIEAMLREFL